LSIAVVVAPNYVYSQDLQFKTPVVTKNPNLRQRIEEKAWKDKLVQSLDSFYDNKQDYSGFSGRVTDRDQKARVFKVFSENENIKFFRTGDVLYFNIARQKSKRCTAFIRGVEGSYLILYIKDIHPCWEKERYFRRGSILVFKSEVLASRIKNGAVYRVVLLKRRKDYLRQLNNINHFLWSYDQQKLLTVTDYDQKIEEMEREKDKALEILLLRKKAKIHLQKELMTKLNQLDNDLDYYMIEQGDLYVDRWNKDQDLDLPVGRRPQEQQEQMKTKKR